MNLKETLEKCPKAKELYYTWTKKALVNLQILQEKDISEGIEREIPEVEEEFVKLFAESTLLTNIHSLFYFFDEHQLFITVIYQVDYGVFVFDINGIVAENDPYWNTRIQAEQAAVADAFILLEQTLNNGKNS